MDLMQGKKVLLCLAFLLLVSGCQALTPEPLPSFGHDSPRPACQVTVDPGRTPYHPVPIVVSPDWGEPVMVAAPLTDACPNDAIEISPDGSTLYFFWSPTVKGSYEELLAIETGTYYAQRKGSDPGVFGTPRFFDLQKGAEEGSVDGCLSFTPDGKYVYFHSTRSSNTGYQQSPPVDDPMDIYVAPIIEGEPGLAVNLGEPVNSPYLDGEHALSPDGKKLFLTSTRPGGVGYADIWLSVTTETGWSDPVNLGTPINSEGWDGQPGFAALDPDTMYFVSDRDGPTSIYRATHTGGEWTEPELMITGYVGEPSLVSDGSIMYFVHVLVDDEGVFGSNIWYVKATGDR